MSMFAEHGGYFIDTASSYAGDESEHLVGEFIAPNWNERVLATKYTVPPRPKDPNAGEIAARASSRIKRVIRSVIDRI